MSCKKVTAPYALNSWEATGRAGALALLRRSLGIRSRESSGTVHQSATNVHGEVMEELEPGFSLQWRSGKKWQWVLTGTREVEPEYKEKHFFSMKIVRQYHRLPRKVVQCLSSGVFSLKRVKPWAAESDLISNLSLVDYHAFILGFLNHIQIYLWLFSQYQLIFSYCEILARNWYRNNNQLIHFANANEF